MAVNRAKPGSNMYPGWDTWTPCPGCLHDCIYCYARSMRGYDMTPRFRESYLKDNLGTGRSIFICSMGDIGGKWNDSEDVKKVLAHCRQFDNTYLLQSKDPANLIQYVEHLPEKTILGTTIETNRDTSHISKAPIPSLRMLAMVRLKAELHLSNVRRFLLDPVRECEMEWYQTMNSMEPIMEFDNELIEWMLFLQPDYVSIGLDSKSHGLVEPTPEKILYLIECLQGTIEVKLKSNLRRLIHEHEL